MSKKYLDLEYIILKTLFKKRKEKVFVYELAYYICENSFHTKEDWNDVFNIIFDMVDYDRTVDYCDGDIKSARGIKINFSGVWVLFNKEAKRKC